MAATLKARAGSSYRSEFRYQTDSGVLIDTTGYTARIQFRAIQPSSRVILDSVEYSGALPAPAGTVLTRLEPGHWELFLGRTLTKSLPPSVRWELEIVSDSNPEDGATIAYGVLLTEPEGIVISE